MYVELALSKSAVHYQKLLTVHVPLVYYYTRCFSRTCSIISASIMACSVVPFLTGTFLFLMYNLIILQMLSELFCYNRC